MELVRELFQIIVVDAIAVFVGQRVDRETTARQRAEALGSALRASETKYRGLFESSPVAILVLDPQGTVLDANPAAGVLFGRAVDALRGVAASDLVGPTGAQQLLRALPEDGRPAAHIVLAQQDGTEVYLEPELTEAAGSRGEPTLQVLLRDVTEEWHRQAGLRAYAAHVLRAQEEERRRIAQELHDDTIQALVVLCRRLDAVEGLGDPLPPPVLEEVREARRSVEEVVEGLRGFARALRPPTLEDLGLVTSIRRLLVDLGERAHLESQLKVVGREVRLPPDQELGVFRIAQEALRNVERHARAAHVTVTIAFAQGGLRIEVLDDGVGFVPPPRGLAGSSQLGLLGMQERAELLGGQLEVRSSPGRGTSVTLSVPLERDLLPTPRGRRARPA